MHTKIRLLTTHIEKSLNVGEKKGVHNGIVRLVPDDWDISKQQRKVVTNQPSNTSLDICTYSKLGKSVAHKLELLWAVQSKYC
jgi:hypothetical protein